MAWNQDDEACGNTFHVLRFLSQFPKTTSFASAGALKMSELLFWPANGSKDMVHLRAQELAGKVDARLKGAMGGSYPPQGGYDKATQAMVDKLIQGGSTVEILADAIRANYVFE
jgi:hypothetical protein